VAAQARVLVVDDHALVRTGVANIISHEADLVVVAEAANGVEAIAAFERYRPDVTLLDLRMPVMEGVEAVRQIRERDPHAKVIVLVFDNETGQSIFHDFGDGSSIERDTGVPQAIASINTNPKGSGQAIGASSATAPLRKFAFSPSLISPIYSTSGGAISFRISNSQ